MYFVKITLRIIKNHKYFVIKQYFSYFQVRRSLKLRGRRKEKLPSGITADYSASFFAQLERDAPSVDGSTPNNNSSSLTTNGTDMATNNGGGSSLTHSSLGSNAGSASLLTHSDSSEASLNSITNQVTTFLLFYNSIYLNYEKLYFYHIFICL